METVRQLTVPTGSCPRNLIRGSLPRYGFLIVMIILSSCGSVRGLGQQQAQDVISLAARVVGVSDVRTIAFSPDGERLAIGTATGDVQLLGASDLRLLRSLTATTAQVSSVAFHPRRPLLAAGCASGEVMVWRTETGELVMRVTAADAEQGVTCVAFDPIEGVVASASLDGRIRLWSIDAGLEVRSFWLAEGITSIAFSPDGELLVSGSDGGVDVREVGTGQRLWTSSRLQGIRSVAFSPDGESIAACSTVDAGVWIWSVEEQRPLRVLFSVGGSTSTLAVVFMQDGKRLLTADNDAAVWMWDLATGQGELLDYVYRWAPDSRVSADVRTLAVSPCGRFIAAGASNGAIAVWEASSLQRVVVSQPLNGITSVAFSRNLTMLAAGTASGQLRLWDTTTWREILYIKDGERISTVWFTQDPRFVACGTEHGLKLWDAETGALASYVLTGEPVAVSAKGDLCAFSSRLGGIALVELPLGTERRLLAASTQGQISSLAFSAAGDLVAAGYEEGMVRIWDIVRNVELGVLRGNGTPVEALTFSPDGTLIASGTCSTSDPYGQCRQGVVDVWDAHSGLLAASLAGGFNTVQSLAFSPNGALLAGATMGLVKVWETSSGCELATLARGWVVGRSVAFSADGTTLAAIDSGGATLRLWRGVDSLRCRPGAATMWVVPDAFSTIQEALDAAAPGDTVYVKAGTYFERLVIDRPVHLVGEDRLKVSIRPPGDQDCTLLVSHAQGEVVVSGLHFRTLSWGIAKAGQGALLVKDCIVTESQRNAGIMVAGGACEVRDTILWGNDCGVILDSGDLYMAECEVVNAFRGSNDNWGVYVVGDKGSSCRIENCTIGAVAVGIKLDIEAELDVTGYGNRIYAFSEPLSPGESSDRWPSVFLDHAWADSTMEASRLIETAEDLREQEAFQASIDACAQCLHLLEAFPFSALGASCNIELARTYTVLARFEEALDAYSNTRAIYEERDMVTDIASIDVATGMVLYQLGLYDRAVLNLRQARLVLERLLTPVPVDYLYELSVALGAMYADRQLFVEALEEYPDPSGYYALGFTEEGVHVAVLIGDAYQGLDRFEQALAAYEEARAQCERTRLPVQMAEIDGRRALVYGRLGETEEASLLYNQALLLLGEAGGADGPESVALDILWPLLFGKGLLNEQLGQLEDAIECYAEAVAVIESIRGGLRTEELKLAWGKRTRRVYERLIDLLHRMGQGAQAVPYTECCRARTFLDILYGGGVGPEQLISAEAGISAGVVSPEAIDAAVDQALAALLPNEAVLSYFTTETGVYLWVIAWNEEEGAHVLSEPVLREYPRTDLLRDVVESRKLLETPSPTAAQKLRLEELLKGLYDALVLPGLARLPEGVDTLVLVPSGPLWYVPFAALLMTDQPSIPLDEWVNRQPYLVEHYTVAYLPSVASLPSLLERTEVGEGVYLGLADPELTEDQLERLGMTEAQSRYTVLQDAAIAFALCQGGESEAVYVGGEASEGRAHQEAPGHRVVVYAAHGQFNPYVPLQSELYLAPESGATPAGERRIADGAYRAWEILLTDHRGTELVVLAACESLLPALRNLQGQLGVLSGKAPDEIELTPEQLEQITTGDEVVGMARAFLSSGAQSVLGTLWQANPGAIVELLASACRHQQTGLSWAQALRQAQSELIAHPTYGHPWFWAPFQMMGRWR